MVRPELSFVIDQFAQERLTASSEWIKACLEWCKTEDPCPTRTPESLALAVRSQWLDTDLRGEGIQSGPQLRAADLHADKLKAPTPLKGTFNLQLLGCHDISKSAYSQLQALKKVNNENTDVTAERTQFSEVPAQNAASQRKLKLTLSDGFSTVATIEHEPCFNKLKETELHPGTKIRLIGPLHVRRGVILLTPQNIKVLGGHVEEMDQEFGLEQQLSTILIQHERSEGTTVGRPNLPTQIYRPPKNAITTQNVSTRQNVVGGRGRNSALSNNRNNTASFIDDNDDAIFTSIDTEINREELDDGDDALFQAIETDLVAYTSGTEDKCSKSTDPKAINNQSPGISADTTTTTLQRSQSIPRPNEENKISTKPFQYLSTVTDRTSGTISIKGTVVTLVGKLSIKQDSYSPSGMCYWHVLFLVTDGTDTIKACLAPQILESWLGVSPTRYLSMTDAEKSEVKIKMKTVSEKFITLNAIMKICFKGIDVVPEIIDIIELNRGHAQQLKIRQK